MYPSAAVPAEVWSRPERLTKGAAWELPSRKDVAAGNRKLHFLWQDGRNNYLHFPMSRFLFQARYNDDLWYRSSDADTTQWNREIKLSADANMYLTPLSPQKGILSQPSGSVLSAECDGMSSSHAGFSMHAVLTAVETGVNQGSTSASPAAQAGALTLSRTDGTLHLFHDSQYR
ncbi:MAG: hypothetical protein V8T86_05330, partial [Victivallis sp.]